MFEYIDPQLETIEVLLKEKELEKYISLLMECLTDCIYQLVHFKDGKDAIMGGEQDTVLSLIIRINDLATVLDQYQDLKSECCNDLI